MLLGMVMFVLLNVGPEIPNFAFAEESFEANVEVGKDVYYQTPGTPAGPTAEEMKSGYPRFGFINNRIVVWMVTQQHTYFGGFVLALPIFCLLLEFIGLSRRDPQKGKRYDELARDILRVSLLALSFTALLGGGDVDALSDVVSRIYGVYGFDI